MKKTIKSIKRWILLSITIICFASPFPNWIYSIVKDIQFSANCGDYLELSADANSVVLAEKHLTTAINYLEENNLTSGQAKWFVAYPKNDISLWFENLKTAQIQLQEMIKDGNYTELEQSNMLMKLRETLMDGGENERITLPLAISLAPNGTLLVWLNSVLWLFMWALGGFMAWRTYRAFDDYTDYLYELKWKETYK